MNKSNNILTVSFLTILLIVIFLTIGWSAFNSSLQIDSLTMVRINNDIRITGFNYVNNENNAISSNENYNINSVYSTINLPDVSSTVTYKVVVTNIELASNIHMGINALSGLPDNLKIISIEGYNLKEKICDDNNASVCGTGAQKTFYITIGYKNNLSFDTNNTLYNIEINFEFKKVFDIIYTGFINPPSFPRTVMEGEIITINFGDDASDSLNIISGGLSLSLNIDYTYNNKVLTFIKPIMDDIYIVNPSTYTITYELNGGIQAEGQITTYSTLNQEKIISPTKEGFVFSGWYETSDFSSSLITSTSQLSGNVTLYACWGTGIAKIGNTYYSTLQDAIDDVLANDVETTIILLSDTRELLTVDAHKNINFNFQDFILSSVIGKPVIENYGTIRISNGTITSDTTQGAINVYSTGIVNMTGGTIIMTGTKQAIYNDGGLVNISGNAYLSSTSNQRATIQNQSNGTLVITGGTIVSTNYYAVDNRGTMTIGNKDGIINTESPVFVGLKYGVYASANYNYYDGIIKGKNNAVNNNSFINELEINYSLKIYEEIINGETYKVLTPARKYTVIFNPNGGVIDEETREVLENQVIGNLPNPLKNNYIFDGWYTAIDGGREIDENELITNDIEFFAHWVDSSEMVIAKIGINEYSSVQDAVNSAPNNTETTIILMRNTTENIIINTNKNIIFDLQNYTIRNSTSYSTITNKGILKLISGTVTSNSIAAAVVNNDPRATFIVSGGNIIATGKRQAIYNDGGTVYIEKDAYLNAKATIESSNRRGTVQNLENSNLIITGGVIESSIENGIALTNFGTTKIGIKDGNIVTTLPVLKGGNIGVYNTGIISFYDGIIKATAITVEGNISDMEDNASLLNSEEIISGITYQTTILN